MLMVKFQIVNSQLAFQKNTFVIQYHSVIGSTTFGWVVSGSATPYLSARSASTIHPIRKPIMYIELANAIKNFPEQLFKFHYNKKSAKSASCNQRLVCKKFGSPD